MSEVAVEERFKVPAGGRFDRLIVLFGRFLESRQAVAWIEVRIVQAVGGSEFFRNCEFYTRRSGVISDPISMGSIIAKSQYADGESVLVGVERPSKAELWMRSGRFTTPTDAEFRVQSSEHLIHGVA